MREKVTSLAALVLIGQIQSTTNMNFRNKIVEYKLYNLPTHLTSPMTRFKLILKFTPKRQRPLPRSFHQTILQHILTIFQHILTILQALHIKNIDRKKESPSSLLSTQCQVRNIHFHHRSFRALQMTTVIILFG